MYDAVRRNPLADAGEPGEDLVRIDGGTLTDNRPRVALVVTTYFAGSHADVGCTRLIRGYEWLGEFVAPRVHVVSMYLEQLGDHDGPQPRPDIGRKIAAKHGVELYPTIAEAMGCGQPGVNVDGVVIIGEHGDYEENIYGQQLYPRRRMFDTAVAAMVAADTFVPVSIDKHLAYSFSDAKAMVDTAHRLGIPILAGSSIPLTWRVPTGATWPAGEEMTRAVCVAWGPVERYGFHILELLQSQAERRAGGETGVVRVQGLHGDAAKEALASGAVPADLLDRALAAADLDEEQRAAARASVHEVFLVTYADGTTAAGVICADAIRSFGFAADGPRTQVAFMAWQEPRPHRFFTFLMRQVEALMLTRRPPYPVERTLLTTGVLDAAMHSRYDGGTALDTPQLAISYQPALDVPDTGVDLPRPPGEANPVTSAPPSDRSVVEEPPA
jgi:hypothetical protein